MDKDVKDRIQRYSLWAVASLTTYRLYERIKPDDARGWAAVFNFMGGWLEGYILLIIFVMGMFLIMGIWHLHDPDDIVEVKHGARMMLMVNAAAATVIVVTVLLYWILDSFVLTPKW